MIQDRIHFSSGCISFFLSKIILNIAGNVYNFKWYYSTSEDPYNINVVASDAGFAVKVID